MPILSVLNNSEDVSFNPSKFLANSSNIKLNLEESISKDSEKEAVTVWKTSLNKSCVSFSFSFDFSIYFDILTPIVASIASIILTCSSVKSALFLNTLDK